MCCELWLTLVCLTAVALRFCRWFPVFGLRVSCAPWADVLHSKHLHSRLLGYILSAGDYSPVSPEAECAHALVETWLLSESIQTSPWLESIMW